MNPQRLTAVLLLAVTAAACGSESSATDPTTPPQDSTVSTTTRVDSTNAATAEAVPAVAAGEKLRVVVDYSPTSSDVAALMYVTQHPSADLLAVTLAGTGESHCAEGVANTRALLATVDLADVPVACGVEKPFGPGNEWPDDWRDAADGLDGLDLQHAGSEAGETTDAADLLASVASDGAPVTIIALAPLTNLAVAIERHDGFADHVAGVVTMGGAIGVEGNASNNAAEWNYFIDPTAVDVVLRSGIRVTMVPLDATNTVPVTKVWFDSLSGHQTTAAANVVHDLFAASRPFEFGFFFWDELAAATAFDPTLVTLDDQLIIIDLDGPKQGQTRVDAAGASVRVAVTADSERFQAGLLSTLNGGVAEPDIGAASSEELDYFVAVEVAVADLSAAIETLFVTPSAQAIEEIEHRADNGELTAEDEVTLRTFLTDFWTTTDEQMRALRATLAQLDPPAFAEGEHDRYLAAIDAVIDAKDDRLADLATPDAAELLSILREPDGSVEAMNAACAALGTAGFRVGIDAETCTKSE